MAQTTQEKYDAAVAKYWKARVDALMKNRGVTVSSWTKVQTLQNQPSTPTISTWYVGSDNQNNGNVTWVIKQDLPFIWRSDGNYTEEELAQNKRAQERQDENARIRREQRRREEARKKRQYKLAAKKAWGSDNLLKLAEKKYWVNSAQYRTIKNKINKYEWPTSTTREYTWTNPRKETTNTVTKWQTVTQTQYNSLMNKYWTIEWVEQALKNKWATQAQINSITESLYQYRWDKPTASKTRTNQTWSEKITAWADLVWKTEDRNLKYLDTVKKETPEKEEKKETVDFKNIQNVDQWKAETGGWMDNLKKWVDSRYWTDSSVLANWELTTKVWDKEYTWRLDSEWNPRRTEKDLKTEWLNIPWVTEEGKTTDKLTKEQEALKKARLSWKTDADLLADAAAKYWEDSDEYKKLKDFLDANPEPDSTEWIWSELLWKTKEELDKEQIDSLEKAMNEDISNTAENFIKWSEIIAWNNEALQAFYAEMAWELREFIKTNTEMRQKALERTKNSELNRVVWQIRATLARRWVQIWNIPPEQIIAMSGELWAEAMRRIDEATTEMENAVAEMTSAKMAEINKLREQWLIKQGEADLNIEQMRQLKEKMISDIKANFTSNVFKITQAAASDADTKKTEVFNTVSRFVSQLWISWTAQGIMENYINASDSVEALRNMISDLNNPDSALYKAVWDVEKAAALAAEFEQKIELMKATKTSSSSSSSWSWTSSKKIWETTLKALIAEWVPNASQYTTYWQLEAAMASDQDLADKINRALAKPNPLEVVGL